jgi:hypothetical protein
MHGHIEAFYFLNSLSIYFVFYRAKKGDPRGRGWSCTGSKKALHILWRICQYASQKFRLLWRIWQYAPHNCGLVKSVVGPHKEFCGACTNMRHRKNFYFLWRMWANAARNSLRPCALLDPVWALRRFCGASVHMRHRKAKFCGAPVICAPQKLEISTEHIFGAPQK